MKLKARLSHSSRPATPTDFVFPFCVLLEQEQHISMQDRTGPGFSQNPHLDGIPPFLLCLGVSTTATVLVYFFIGLLLVVGVFVICSRRTVLVN